MIMKQTPFAWLASLFSSKSSLAKSGKASNTGKNSVALGGASRDGVPGAVVITDKDGNVIFNSGANPKMPVTNEVVKTKLLSKEEEIAMTLEKNFNPNDLVMMSEETFDKLTLQDWVWNNKGLLLSRAIFIPAQKNVAILKS